MKTLGKTRPRSIANGVLNAEPLPRWGRWSWLIPVCLVIWGALCGGLAWEWRELYLSSVQETRQQVVSLAKVLADQVSTTLANADMMLLASMDAFPPDVLTGPDHPDVSAFFRRQVVRANYVEGLFSVDATGISHSGSGLHRGELDLRERDYFKFHRDNPALDLRVNPMERSLTRGDWVLRVSRRVDVEGRFVGLVGASISSTYFTNFYNSIKFNRDCALGLYTQDGWVLVRQPLKEGEIGKNVGSSPLYTTYLKQQDSGAYEIVSPLDGMTRYIGYAKLQQFPLVVTVGLSRQDVMGRIWREGAAYLLFGLFVGTVLMAGAFTLRQFCFRVRALALLRDQREALGRGNADLERFTEVLAHHLQEPARLQHAFALRIKKLLGDEVSPDVAQALAYMIGGADRLRSLLRDVQLYLALGQSGWRHRPCDLGKAAHEAERRLSDKIDKAEATVIIEPLPHVMAGHERMVDVFLNLIDNSLVHYEGDGVPNVRIWVQRTEGNWVTVAVQDNGIGIPAEFHERVFLVFERLFPERRTNGTGIGLALVQKIIESAGGRTWIETPDEGGMCLLFRLALVKE